MTAATFFGLGSAFMGLLLVGVLLGGAIPGLEISGAISTGMPVWLNVGGLLAAVATGTIALLSWSRRVGWGESDRLAAAAGLLLTYAWYGIVQQSLGDEWQAFRVLGNVFFALGALTLVLLAWRRVRLVPDPTASVPEDIVRARPVILPRSSD